METDSAGRRLAVALGMWAVCAVVLVFAAAALSAALSWLGVW